MSSSIGSSNFNNRRQKNSKKPSSAMGHQHSIHTAGMAEERKKIFEDRFSHILNFIQNGGGEDEREGRDEGQVLAT
jgi:hypothetical protein